MNKPPLMKSGRNMIAIALSALLPLTIAQAEEETMYPQSGELEQERMQSQTAPYDSHMRGAEGPARSELQTQGYTGERLDAQTFPPCAPNEKSAPNAYYGEESAISSPQGRATLFGRGRWC